MVSVAGFGPTLVGWNLIGTLTAVPDATVNGNDVTCAAWKSGALDVRLMTVNGQPRQKSDLNMLIWNIAELIADLSKFYHLQPGDLIFTGTPEGVGPVVAGDRLDGRVAGVGEIVLHVGPAE